MPFSVPGLADAVAPIARLTNFPNVNTFALMGIPMPGQWTLLRAPKVFNYQIQLGYGLDYANILPTGVSLVTAQFRGVFWTSVDFATFKQVRSAVLARGVFAPRGAPTPIGASMGITHPELNAMGVTSVIVKELQPAIQEEGGLWVTQLELLQWKPPLPAVPKVPFSVPGNPATSLIGPPDRQTAEMSNNAASIDKLNGAILASKKPP